MAAGFVIAALYMALGVIVVWYALPYLLKKSGQYLLRRRCKMQRAISLTYDDGPSAALSVKLIQLLGDYDAKATFFVLGHKIQSMREVAETLVRSGHEIGSHSYRHLNAWKKSPFAVYRDIERGLVQTMKVGSCMLFRPPHGKATFATLLQVLMNKCQLAWWTIDSSDTWPTLMPAMGVIERIRQDGGGVLLMHDHDRVNGLEREAYVLDLTRHILEFARNEGFKVCKMSELINS